MSSILSTSSCGEGTQTTSLPDWPTSGLNSASGVCAKAQTAIAEKTSADTHRLVKRHTVMFFLQSWVTRTRGGRDDGPASPGSSTPVPAGASPPAQPDRPYRHAPLHGTPARTIDPYYYLWTDKLRASGE